MSAVLMPVYALDGHRREFLELFVTAVQDVGCSVVHDRLGLRHLFFRGPLLSLQLEERPMTFCALACGRALLRRRSVALLFRPNEASTGMSLRLRAKRAALRAVKLFPSAAVLTIVPFDETSPFERIASGWIYDPQLWDWCDRAPPIDKPMAVLVRAGAAGRRVVVTIGVQNTNKGFDFFARLWLSSPKLRREMMFVCAGDATACDPDLKRRFQDAGGLLVDRLLEITEIRALYDVADIVWACYAPNYNQASGIFGRAFQLGVPVVGRAGASLNDLADRIGYPLVALPWDDLDSAAKILLGHFITGGTGAVSPTTMREQSLARAFRALGLARTPGRL